MPASSETVAGFSVGAKRVGEGIVVWLARRYRSVRRFAAALLAVPVLMASALAHDPFEES
jgi:hypothetical protein